MKVKSNFSAKLTVQLLCTLLTLNNFALGAVTPSDPAGPGTTEPPREEAPAAASLYSAALDQALQQYKAAPAETTFARVLDTLRPLLSQPGAMRYSAAVLSKDNPGLADLKPRVLEAAGVRVWTFTRVPERHMVIVQWVETRQQQVQVGRRKRIDTKTFLHAQSLTLPQSVLVREAGFIAQKDEPKTLVLSGDSSNGSLWLSAWRTAEGGWREAPGFFDGLPAFLIKNVSGHVGFKGNDLIFNIARMVDSVDANGNHCLLPEAESATYKFWVKPTDAGFTIVPSIPDVEAFSTVIQFMTAVQQGRAESTKPILSDARLAAIPRYLGLSGKTLDPSARVVQMVVPPGRGQRYRLINIAKDDLIFDIGKVKGTGQVKALFIAPPDPFLAETSKYFPLYSKLLEQPDKDAPTQPAPGADRTTPPGKAQKLHGNNRLGSAPNGDTVDSM